MVQCQGEVQNQDDFDLTAGAWVEKYVGLAQTGLTVAGCGSSAWGNEAWKSRQQRAPTDYAVSCGQDRLLVADCSRNFLDIN